MEHTSIISQLIHEAKVNRKDLTVVWLDLSNAYGTIPHMLKKSRSHYTIYQSTSVNNQKLFRRDQFAVYNKQVYNDLAETSEGHSDWMYHLSYSIRYGDEHDHKGWREKN